MKYLLFISVLCQSFSLTYSQNVISKLISEDTLHISYLSGFNYDVLQLYANGIKVDQRILYSERTSGNAKAGVQIGTTTDTIELCAYYYQRNHTFSLEYNALWGKWNPNQDNAWYSSYPKMCCTLIPHRLGKYISVSVESSEGDEDSIPIIRIRQQQSPFVLD